MIRDGGSFAATFENRERNQYTLFTEVHFANVGPPKKDEHGHYQEKELVGYDEPVIIDCDPAKRPHARNFHRNSSAMCLSQTLQDIPTPEGM